MTTEPTTDNWLRETLSKIKQSQILTQFFVRQRKLGKFPAISVDMFWTDDLEQLVMEMLLSRSLAKRDKNFQRADSYCYVLDKLGLDVRGLDLELHPSRTTPQQMLKDRAGK